MRNVALEGLTLTRYNDGKSANCLKASVFEGTGIERLGTGRNVAKGYKTQYVLESHPHRFLEWTQ